MNIAGHFIDGAFNKVFAQYDRDNSGYLDQGEVVGFFNGVFSLLHVPITVSPTQGWLLMKFMDKNGDGRIGRDELSGMTKRIVSAGSVAAVVGG